MSARLGKESLVEVSPESELIRTVIEYNYRADKCGNFKVPAPLLGERTVIHFDSQANAGR